MKLQLTLALVALAAPCVRAQISLFEDTDDRVVSTTLADVRENPQAFKNVWVRFPVQFCSIGKVQNPFFTRFVPSQFANFYAWDEDQKIWQRPAYDDVFGTLFLSKDNEQLEELYRLELYERIMVTGIVRNVFQSKPWIEVTAFQKVEGRVDAPTLAHLYRGESHMERRQWNRAISELSIASAGDVPNNVMSAVHANLGVCYLRLGESDTALMHLEQAERFAAGHASREFQNMVSSARQAPEEHLDREVDAVELGDFERPMWEAFEEATAMPLR